MAYKRKTKAPKNIYRGRATKRQRRRPTFKNATKNTRLRKKEKRQGKKSGSLGYHHGRTGVKLKNTKRSRKPYRNYAEQQKYEKIMAPKGGFRFDKNVPLGQAAFQKHQNQAIRKMQKEGRSTQYMKQQLANMSTIQQTKLGERKSNKAAGAKADRNMFSKFWDRAVGNSWGGKGQVKSIGKGLKNFDKMLDKGWDKIGLGGTNRWLEKNASAGDVIHQIERGLYGNVNAGIEALQKGGKRPGNYDFTDAWKRGASLKKKPTGYNLMDELLKEASPWAKGGMKKHPNWTNTGKAIGGLGLDIGLDPLSYVGVGIVNKGSQITKAVGRVPYVGAKSVIDKLYKPQYLAKGLKEADKIAKALARADVTPSHFRNTKVGKELMAGRSSRATTKKQYYSKFTEDEIRKVLTGRLKTKVTNRAGRAKVVAEQQEIMDEMLRPLHALAIGKRKGLTPSEIARARQLSPVIKQALDDEEAGFARVLYGDAANRPNIGREDRLQYWYDEAANSLEEQGTPFIQRPDGTWRLSINEKDPPRINIDDPVARANNPASVMKQAMEDINELHSPVGKLNAFEHLSQAAPVNQEIRVRQRALEKFKSFWTPSKNKDNDYDFAIQPGKTDNVSSSVIEEVDRQVEIPSILKQGDGEFDDTYLLGSVDHVGLLRYDDELKKLVLDSRFDSHFGRYASKEEVDFARHIADSVNSRTVASTEKAIKEAYDQVISEFKNVKFIFPKVNEPPVTPQTGRRIGYGADPVPPPKRHLSLVGSKTDDAATKADEVVPYSVVKADEPINLKDPDFEARMAPLVTQADRTAAHEIAVVKKALNTHPRPKRITVPKSAREAFKADGNMMPKKINGEMRVPPFRISDFKKWLEQGTQTERLRKVSPERIAFNRIIEEQAGNSLHELRRLKQEALAGYDSSVRVPLSEEKLTDKLLKADAKEAIRVAKENGDLAEVKAIEKAVAESEEAAKAVRKELRVELVLDAVRRSADTEKVGLALRVLGKDVMLIPGSRQFLQAMKVVNSAPVMAQITAAINKGFKPVQRMDWQLHQLMVWKHRTNAAIKDDVLRLADEVFKGIDEAAAIRAWDNLVRKGPKAFEGNTDSVENRMIDYIENWIRPILNGDTTVAGRPLTIGEINRWMPARYLLEKSALEGQFNDVDSVLRAFGTQSRPYDRIKGNARGVKAMPARPIEPLNLLGNIRTAIHEAHAWRHFNDGASEFGYRVDNVLDANTLHGPNSFMVGADERMLKLGWKPVEGLDQSHIYPKEIAADLQKVVDMFKKENIDSTLAFFDKATRAWKIPATIMNPGYYTRNSIGEIIMGWIGGVNNPIWYDKAGSVLHWARKNDAPLDGGKAVGYFEEALEKGTVAGGRVMVKRKDGMNFTTQEIKLGYEDQGLTSTFTRNEIRDPNADPVAEFVKRMGGLPMNPLPYAFGKVRRLGEVAEDHPRLAHYMHALQHAPPGLSKQGVSEWAAREVRNYHFDYSDVTPFEQAVMARVFPFYKWTRKAVPVILEAIMAQPGKVMAYPKVMTALAYSENPNYQADGLLPDYDAMKTPEFLRKMLAYPLGVDGQGNDLFTRIAVPATDIFQVLFDPDELAKLMLNPYFKVPIEWLQGHNLGATGRLDEDGFQTFKDYMVGAAQSLPQSKFLTNSNETDQSYGDRFTDYRGSNFFTGLTSVPWGNRLPSTEFGSEWIQNDINYESGNIDYQKKGMEMKRVDRLIKRMSNPKNNPYFDSYTEVNLRKKYNPDRYPGADKYIDKYGKLNWPIYNAFRRQYEATHSPKEIRRNKIAAEAQQARKAMQRFLDGDPKTKNFKYKKFKKN